MVCSVFYLLHKLLCLGVLFVSDCVLSALLLVLYNLLCCGVLSVSDGVLCILAL